MEIHMMLCEFFKKRYLTLGVLNECLNAFDLGTDEARNQPPKSFKEDFAAVKPAVQLLQIQEVHPVAHSSACNFCRFFIYFSYLFYLGHLSLLGHQTKTRRQSNSSTFCSFKSCNPETFMSSAVTTFVHATLKRSQKVARFGSLGWIPMIQVPFHSSCVALQYETRTKFFRRAVPKLYAVKNSINFCYFTIETLNKIRINQRQSFLGGTKILCSHQRPS